jgi:hypothetical protein
MRKSEKADFIHKVGVAEKEASETAYWLEICEAAPLGDTSEVCSLLNESREILAMVTTIGRKAKGRALHRVAGIVSSVAIAVAGLFSLSRFPLSAFH